MDIYRGNALREKTLFSPFACKSSKAERFVKDKQQSQDIRPAFAHDTDRIIHSKAYARYIDKTQVFYLFENDHLTHRVLHVQMVSKIARTIGRALRLNEDLIEAISLGHDLGHVPYGHEGETILNNLCQEHGIGGFAHNVQSVRCLMELENLGHGCNLAIQVLDGILAHNGEMLQTVYVPEYDKTLEKFKNEYDACMRDPRLCEKLHPMTLEGCVVRVSDVIAYIGRDIEDAITIGLIDRIDLPDEVTTILGSCNRDIVNALAMDIIDNSYGKDQLCFSEDIFAALRSLMDFNYTKIYRNERIRTQSTKISHMFGHLLQEYIDELNASDQESSVYKGLLRSMDESYILANSNVRIAVDFMAGMTDHFFNNQYRDRFVPVHQGYMLND